MKKMITALAIVALVLVGCTTNKGQKDENKIIRVGASPTPHAIMLEAVKPLLAEKGYTLEVIEFTDYVLPNTALQAGDLEANFFQHTPYLSNFNAKNNTTLVGVLDVHFEPLGIYAGKSTSLSDIEGKTFAIPNDTTNEARALQLLAKLGYITVDPSKGLEATPRDIIDNPHNLKFIELVAESIPHALADVDFGIINGNYALLADLGGKVLSTESQLSEGAQMYANILAVKAGQETSEKTTVLIEVLQSETLKKLVKEKFGDLVVLLTK